MPVQFSKASVIEKNRLAIAACDQAIERLGGMFGLSVSREATRIAQLSRASNEKTELRTINANLRAAGTTVRPMDDDLAEELNSLGNKLDQKIRNNQIIDASLDFIKSMLDDINRLRSIVDVHRA